MPVRSFVVYRLLAASTALVCLLVGTLFIVAFLDRVLFPVFAHPLFATAAAMILAAVVRLLAWYSGEYRLAADELRAEAAVLLAAALGFVWLRPSSNAADPHG